MILDKKFIIKKIYKRRGNRFFFANFFFRIFFFIRKCVLFSNVQISFLNKIYFLLRSFLKFNFINIEHFINNKKENYVVNKKFRKNIQIKESDNFDKDFNKILPYILPINFLENLSFIIKILKELDLRIEVVISSYDINYNDYYKIFCVFYKKLNITLQHGGAYFLRYRTLENIERKEISDKFIGYKNKQNIDL